MVLGLLTVSAAQAQTTNLYHTNRVFSPIVLTNYPNISAYRLVNMASQLTEVVGTTNIFINTNATKAVEYEGFAWGYESANAAWTSVVAVYQSYSRNHTNKIYDNAGWVRGTKEAYGSWGAYLWYLQNQISFTTSVTNVWISPHGVTNRILQVLVGSLGDYPPQTNVLDIGPTNWALITNYLGSGIATDVVYKANLDTYYELLIPDLIVMPPTNSLLMTNVFMAMSYPTRFPPTNYLFEVRRAASTNWYTITNGPSSAVTTVVAVAGTFNVRVTAWLTNAVAISTEREFVAQFPSYQEIIANTAVIQRTSQAWSNTLAATTSTGRREEGFWIQVNTQSQRYEFAATDIGPTVGPYTNASVRPRSKPSDSHLTPSPIDRPTYTIAYFHTHTPTTYRPHGRAVGPSRADSLFHNNYDVVGVVQDYSAISGGNIPSNHPIGSASQLYHSGPNRRTLPP